MPDVRDRQYLITMHKKARKSGLDLHTYNQLKDRLACVQTDLARLKDPLVPPHRAQVLVDPLAGGGDDGAGGGQPSGLLARIRTQIRLLRDEIKSGQKI